jgi:aminomethyltransferase
MALDPGVAQYTVIPNEGGGAIDDAYLYRLEEGDPLLKAGHLLVVNAANAEKDWNWSWKGIGGGLYLPGKAM